MLSRKAVFLSDILYNQSMKSQFADVAINETNPKWDQAISRSTPLYPRKNDIRSPFFRDYTRIIHSRGYRRLKHKTQVFYATNNDHICTRMEHVQHVEAVSNIISDHLGLHTELARAIALGHDIGHPPFGHEGEKILSHYLPPNCNLYPFWHEKNGLRFVDYFENLPDPSGTKEGLNLTYAVRDGIVCHCGETNNRTLIPRSEALPLHSIQHPGITQPFTWEGCVVRIADTISYVGRDIEDALSLKILNPKQMNILQSIYDKFSEKNTHETINNTVLIHTLIMDLCKSSSPTSGLHFSEPYYNLLQELRNFSKQHIYEHPRLKVYKKYAQLMISSIYDYLKEEQDNIVCDIQAWQSANSFPLLSSYFSKWLLSYSNISSIAKQNSLSKHFFVYTIPQDFSLAIVEFISGMTDHFIMKLFEEMTRFE
jgi:dGTPase